MPAIRRILAVSALLTTALVVSACGATDAAKQANAGLNTAGYFKAIQPQLQQYGATISKLAPAGPPSAEKTKRIEAASKTLAGIKKDLQKVEPADDYAKAHKALIASVGDSVAALDKLAAASAKGDAKAYNDVLSGEYADSRPAFAESSGRPRSRSPTAFRRRSAQRRALGQSTIACTTRSSDPRASTARA